MNSYIRTIIAFTAALMLLCACSKEAGNAPSAVRGEIDLSAWDFSSRGTVVLDGEWEFYWNRFISPEEFKDGNRPGEADYMLMPGFWNGRMISGNKLPGHGFATMRLRVRLGGDRQLLALNIPHMYTAYRLWINGIEKSSNGTTGTDATHAIPRFLTKTIIIHPESDTLELVLHVSNFHHPRGGMWSSILIGTDTQITDRQRLLEAFNFLILGGLLVTALYHIAIFLFRKKDRASLFFGLLCLAMALRVPFEGDRVMIEFFPWISWEINEKISYITFFGSLSLINLYIYYLFKDIYSRAMVRACTIIGIVFCIGVLVLTSQTYYFTRYPYYANLLFWVIYDVYVILRAVMIKKEGAGYLIGGMVALLITVFIDVLYHDRIIDTGNVSGFGVLVFTISQAIFLSDRSSKAFNHIEILSSEKAHLFASSIDIISSILLASSTRLYEFTRNVTRISVRLAARTGISRDGIEEIRIASLLHDIGMMGTPEEIAGSEMRKSEDGKTIIEGHPQKSINIIASLKELAGVKLIIAQHHERFDGSGYPAGLAGTEITPGARIIGLADDFVNMLGMREFQTKDKKTKIIAELIRRKGKFYDPDLVDTLIQLIEKQNLIYVIDENDIRHKKNGDVDEWVFPSNVNYEISVVEKVISGMKERISVREEDMHLIESALGEIIRNAIIHGNKYDESKHVTVKFTILEKEGRNVLEFRVADEGSGMDLSRYHHFRDGRFKLYDITREIRQQIPEMENPQAREILARLNTKLQAFLMDYYINYNKFRQIESPEASGGVGLIMVMHAFNNVDFRNIVENNSLCGMEVILEKYVD